jgi:hypothetical protein
MSDDALHHEIRWNVGFTPKSDGIWKIGVGRCRVKASRKPVSDLYQAARRFPRYD